jgi:hypothetical protein
MPALINTNHVPASRGQRGNLSEPHRTRYSISMQKDHWATLSCALVPQIYAIDFEIEHDAPYLFIL